MPAEDLYAGAFQVCLLNELARVHRFHLCQLTFIIFISLILILIVLFRQLYNRSFFVSQEATNAAYVRPPPLKKSYEHSQNL